MQITMEIIVSIFLVFGAFFMLVGSIGMVRLPDLFMRLHAPTKSSTLGLGSFLIASMILFLPTLKQLQTNGPSLFAADIGIPASSALRCNALKRSRLNKLATQSRSGNMSDGAI